MKHPFYILFYLIFPYLLLGQTGNGSYANDWKLNDIQQKEHHLQKLNHDGKSVILNFSATWCSISWGYKNGPILQNIYKKFGPEGSKELEIFLIEKDLNTKLDCLYGKENCTGGTMGDWANNTLYPIVNIESANLEMMKDYDVKLFPTIYIVSPDLQIIELGTATEQKIESYLQHSFKLNATASIIKPNCKNNGAINLEVVGGYKSLNFRWSNGEKTKNLQNLASGNYSVTITDQNNYSKSFNFKVDGLPKLSINEHKIQNLKCHNDSTGAVEIVASGGRSILAYKWSNGSAGAKVNRLTAGLYSVVVSDVDGCSVSESFLIKQPELLTFSVESSPTNCNQPTGCITLISNGGWGNYSYRLNSEMSQTSNKFDHLPKGRYRVEVQDQQLCKLEKEVTILEKTKPQSKIAYVGYLSCVTEDSTTLKLINLTELNNHSFRWSNNDNNIVSNLPTFTTNSPGIIHLKISSMETGCEFDTIFNILRKDAIPSYAILKEKTENGVKYSFEGHNATYLYWQIGDSVSHDSTIALSDKIFGQQIVSLVASNYCHTNSIFDTLSIVAIDSLRFIEVKDQLLTDGQSVNQLKVFPSPAIKSINVSILFDFDNFGELVIEDAKGKEIVNYRFEGRLIEKNINIHDWEPGLYYAKVKSKEVNLVKMFMVVR